MLYRRRRERPYRRNQEETSDEPAEQIQETEVVEEKPKKRRPPVDMEPKVRDMEKPLKRGRKPHKDFGDQINRVKEYIGLLEDSDEFKLTIIDVEAERQKENRLTTGWANYLIKTRNFSENTASSYMYSLGWLVEYCSQSTRKQDRMMSTLSYESATRFINWLGDELKSFEKYSAANVNAILLRCRLFYDYVLSFRNEEGEQVDFGIPGGRNPFLEIRPLKVATTIVERRIDHNTYLKAFAQIKSKHRTNDIKLAFLLCYYGGLRVSETTGVKVNDVAVEETNGARWLKVKVTGKGQKTRETLVFDKDGIEQIEELIKDRPAGEFLVHYQKKRRTLCNIATLISKIVFKKAGVFTFHKLRHSYGYSLADKGVDIGMIATLMGHSNLNTTMIYAKPTIDMIKARIVQGAER